MAKAGVHVGPTLRRLRKASGISVRGLASKAGFTASFISQVERGLASPSISSLERIASGVGVTLGQFFRSTRTDGPSVVKAEQRHAIQSAWSRAKLEGLGPASDGSRLEALLITMAWGGSSGKRPHTSQSDQMAIVFEGKVLLTLEGDDYQLGRGDSVSIPAGVPHRWSNVSRKHAQIILVSVRMP